MAQSQFDRIAALFEAARALPSDEWAQYLEVACPDRQDLRDEVLEMLIEKERAFSWFDSLEDRLHVGAALRDGRVVNRGARSWSGSATCRGSGIRSVNRPRVQRI